MDVRSGAGRKSKLTDRDVCLLGMNSRSCRRQISPGHPRELRTGSYVENRRARLVLIVEGTASGCLRIAIPGATAKEPNWPLVIAPIRTGCDQAGTIHNSYTFPMGLLRRPFGNSFMRQALILNVLPWETDGVPWTALINA